MPEGFFEHVIFRRKVTNGTNRETPEGVIECAVDECVEGRRQSLATEKVKTLHLRRLRTRGARLWPRCRLALRRDGGGITSARLTLFG